MYDRDQSVLAWLETVAVKSFIYPLCIVMGLGFPIPAFGQSAVSSYVAQLQHQGYGDFQISTTLLGRTRILATRGGVTREIVVARNGQILFDYLDVDNKPLSNPIPEQSDNDDPPPDSKTDVISPSDGDGGRGEDSISVLTDPTVSTDTSSDGTSVISPVVSPVTTVTPLVSD